MPQNPKGCQGSGLASQYISAWLVPRLPKSIVTEEDAIPGDPRAAKDPVIGSCRRSWACRDILAWLVPRLLGAKPQGDTVEERKAAAQSDGLSGIAKEHVQVWLHIQHTFELCSLLLK